MKKICIALFLVLALSFAASADVMFTVVDNTYASGSAGLVTSDASGDLTTTKNVVTGLNGDHAAYSFNNAAGKSRVMLSQYTIGQPDTVWIYDPASGDWSQPIEVQWAGMSNRRGVATSGSNLFAICYDVPNLVKVDMTSDKYTQSASYTFTPAVAAQDYDLHGEAVEVVGSHVYALFTVVKDPWTTADYQSSVLVKLDQNLNEIARAEVGKNALKMAVYDNKLYVASVGGKQNYGSYNGDSMLQMVDADTMAVTTLLKASTMTTAGWAYDFHNILFVSNDAYVLAGAYDSYAMSFEGFIYKTPAAQLQTGNIGAEFVDTTDNSYWGMGYSWDMQYDSVMDKLVCVFGYLLMLFDPAGVAPAQEIGAQAVGGNLYSACVIVGDVEVPSGGGDPDDGSGNGSGGDPDDGSDGVTGYSSSSGCNAGMSSLLLLTGALVFSVRRKK